jgi:SRSO17 transposase
MLRMSEVNAADRQAMQHMLTSECVDWAGLRGVVAEAANALLGGDDAVLILDESGFAKKGEASAGVARQWNGRLYLPQSWVSDPERCKQAAIPKAEQCYRAKSELALEMGRG